MSWNLLCLKKLRVAKRKKIPKTNPSDTSFIIFSVLYLFLTSKLSPRLPIEISSSTLAIASPLRLKKKVEIARKCSSLDFIFNNKTLKLDDVGKQMGKQKILKLSMGVSAYMLCARRS